MSIKRKIIFILMIGWVTACQNYSDPFIEPLINYSFDKSGSDQKAFAGNYLKDSIGLQIVDNLNQPTHEPLMIRFDIMKGGGTVDQPVVITTVNESAFTNWKLGDESGEQTVRARIFDSSDKRLSDVYFNAYGFKDNTWNPVSSKPDRNMLDMAIDTLNRFTFMTTYDKLYRQGVHYFDWEEIRTVNIDNPRAVEIDSEGTLYAGNWNGDLSKSKDHGNTWISCSSPMSGSTNFNFVVTSDNYIWATALGYPLHYSKDGGMSWIVDSVGLGTKVLLNDIYRMRDGSYWLCALVTELYAPRIFHSDGNGASWIPARVPGDPVKLYVSTKDEIVISSYYDGFSIMKSTDRGKHYTRIYHSGASLGLYLSNFIIKSNGFYYALVPGEGILKSKDLNAFEADWYNNKLVGLFTDHNSVLIASQMNNRKVYYRRNSE